MAEEIEVTENLEFWRSVEETPPEYAKDANNGRFDFTSVDPHSQLMRATALWGQYGVAWGIRSMNWSVLKGDTGDVLIMYAEFFYPGHKDGKEVSFEYAIDVKWRPGWDMCKNAITMFRSKCLSQLGFNADCFFGLYESEEYQHEMGVKYGNQDAICEEAMEHIENSTEADDLETWRVRILTAMAGQTIDPGKAKKLLEAIDNRLDEISSK